MSPREERFAVYIASVGVNLHPDEVESAEADFNAGWDAANKEAQG